MSLTQPQSDFEAQSEGERQGFFAEFIDFLKFNKKWWLLPIVIVILLLGLLVFLSGGAIAPFIYTLF